MNVTQRENTSGTSGERIYVINQDSLRTHIHTHTDLDKHVTLNKIFLSSTHFTLKKEFEIICREGLKSYHIQNMQFDIYANTSLVLPCSVG
jgi:hypothetical protein